MAAPSASAGKIVLVMSLKAQVQEYMKTAMKAGDKDRLKVVRLILAAVKQIEIDERTTLDDVAVLAVLNKMVKQRRDSIRQFTDGGREDLARIELAEIEVLDAYLPEPLSHEDLDKLIEQAISEVNAESIHDMGKVMGQVKVEAAGRADMAVVGARVKERLS